uniref:Uncharacterized protein n=1 Tax=Glossina austeni TaxID=7395 RepID=A0A1A9V3C5_GLOAU
MNRVLPKNIRCISWMPIQNHLFSARFDCITRTYRYFFPKGNLNITVRQGLDQGFSFQRGQVYKDQEKEEPSVINELLNLYCSKTQYTPAIAFHLNLYHGEFRDKSEQKTMNECQQEIRDLRDLTKWLYKENNLRRLIEILQSEWSQAQIKAIMIRSTLDDLEQLLEKKFNAFDVNFQTSLLQDDVKSKSYQKLMNRKICGKWK